MLEPPLNYDTIRAAGLTQAEFGSLVGVSRPTVSLWVNGRVAPGRRHHATLSRADALLQDLIAKDILPPRKNQRKKLLAGMRKKLLG